MNGGSTCFLAAMFAAFFDNKTYIFRPALLRLQRAFLPS
jgi:hypothetical protein